MSRTLTLFPIALLIASAAAAQQQYMVTTALQNGAIQIQNSNQTFNLFNEAGFSIDEAYLAFVQVPTGSVNDGVWVLDMSTGAFTHLAGLGAQAGSASITSFGLYDVVKGNQVIFSAYTNLGAGIYSVPVAGGAISVIADQSTSLPGGGTGTYTGSYNPDGVVEADDQKVVFAPYNPVSVFVASLNGSNLAGLGDAATPAEVPNSNCSEADIVFQQPRVFNKKAVFIGGTNGFDWSDAGLFLTSLSGIPLGRTCLPNNYIQFPPVVDYQTVLPGVPANIVFGGYSLLAIDNENIYFTDNTSQALFAVSLTDLSSPVLLLGINQQLPGMPPPPYTITSLAAQYGIVAIEANTVIQGAETEGIFAYSNNAFSRIAETGDTLFGGVVGYNLFLGPNAISNGRIVFGANAGNEGALLASPATCASNITSQIKASFGPVTPITGTNQQFQYVVLENTGAASIPGPVSIALYGLNTGISLANQGAGHTACTGLAPLGNPYAPLSVNAIPGGGKVTAKLTYNNPYNDPVSYTFALFSGTAR